MKESITYDPTSDRINVGEFSFSGDFMRAQIHPTPLGKAFRVVATDDKRIVYHIVSVKE